MTADPSELTLSGLRQLGLVAPGDNAELVPLTGGVASDIWLVRGVEHPFAVKRALEKLRVAADWHAPVSRNASEVAWLKRAGLAAPDAVPRILAHDAELGFFAMDFLEPKTHPVWKRELSQGHADPAFAAMVGRSLAAIHASTANQPEIAGDFNEDSLFRALRIEPYLEFTATRHPEIADKLQALGASTLATHRALVHGDVSPKNILMGPKGPIFLDAECAWYGDPAFDLAFCLNHLMLKCLWNPSGTAGFLASFDKLVASYTEAVTWEDANELEARAAALLPALLLARIDGKSPVEYITEAAPKAFVRRFAIPLIARAPATLASVRLAWGTALAQGVTQ